MFYLSLFILMDGKAICSGFLQINYLMVGSMSNAIFVSYTVFFFVLFFALLPNI
jgi:hypothetical protein